MTYREPPRSACGQKIPGVECEARTCPRRLERERQAAEAHSMRERALGALL